MNKFFMLPEDLFIELIVKYPKMSNADQNEIAINGKSFIYSYDITKTSRIKTRFFELDFKRESIVPIKQVEQEPYILYFLIHTSDERHFAYKSLSHFQIKQELRGRFWLSNAALNDDSFLKIQTVFFMHERSCTAYSFFTKALKERLSLEQFGEKLESLFDLHNVVERDRKKSEFMDRLGYGGKSKFDKLTMKERSILYNDIRKYYV